MRIECVYRAVGTGSLNVVQIDLTVQVNLTVPVSRIVQVNLTVQIVAVMELSEALERLNRCFVH
jgi:ABC-type uncharacterized transport system permease subunit